MIEHDCVERANGNIPYWSDYQGCSGPVTYIEAHRGWFLEDGGRGQYAITYCPYCGFKLEPPKPEPTREEILGRLREEIVDGLDVWARQMEEILWRPCPGPEPPDVKIEVSRKFIERLVRQARHTNEVMRGLAAVHGYDSDPEGNSHRLLQGLEALLND